MDQAIDYTAVRQYCPSLSSRSAIQNWITGIVDSSSFSRLSTAFSLYLGAATNFQLQRGWKHTDRKPRGRRILCYPGALHVQAEPRRSGWRGLRPCCRRYVPVTSQIQPIYRGLDHKLLIRRGDRGPSSRFALIRERALSRRLVYSLWPPSHTLRSLTAQMVGPHLSRPYTNSRICANYVASFFLNWCWVMHVAI